VPLSQDEIAALQALRRELHRFPEVAGSEMSTAKRLVGALAPLKPDDILTGLGGNGVAAIFEGAKPGATVMLRAELDALPIEETEGREHRSVNPGCSHACGHDGHMASLIGCAMEFSRRRPRNGRVVLLFQPSEENGSGAAAVMLDARYSELRPDYAFAYHNMPGIAQGEVALRDGTMLCGSVGLEAVFQGRASHASQPELGISPAVPVAALIQEISRMVLPDEVGDDLAMTTVTHCQLGEYDFGTAPGRAMLLATFRAAQPGRLERLKRDAACAVRSLALEHGLVASLSWRDEFKATVNDPRANGVLRLAFRSAGLRLHDLKHPVRGSEDFGRFGEMSRASMFLMGAGDVGALHSPNYDFPDALIPAGAEVLTTAARLVTEGALEA
jgi:amidohydrolase